VSDNTIAYWMDRPLSDLSREELEREFCKAHQEIQRLQTDICNRSVAHIRDLAAMKRGR
jgi:hypothetical protein